MARVVIFLVTSLPLACPTNRSRLHRMMETEIDTPLQKKPPSLRREFQRALNPTQQRSLLDQERNDETARMTAEFYATFTAGVFEGWKCRYDYGRGHPTNPEVLIGGAIAKDFGDEHGIHKGAIVAFNKPWWQIRFEDLDTEDLNFKQLTNLHTPPSFAALQYAPHATTAAPATACNDFLATAPLKGGDTSAAAVFTLSGDTWKLIAVFKDDSGRMVGAYCPLPDYSDVMDDLTRQQLALQHDTVEVALFSDIRLWISASEKLAAKVPDGSRNQRRRQPPPTEQGLPKRPRPSLKKYTGPHDSGCSAPGCLERTPPDFTCYCCKTAIHQPCAEKGGQDRAIEVGRGKSKKSEWVCNCCWVRTYAEAPGALPITDRPLPTQGDSTSSGHGGVESRRSIL